jgi:hypothetical protein
LKLHAQAGGHRYPWHCIVLARHIFIYIADIRATQESMQPVDRQHFIDKVRSSIPRNLTKKRTPKVIDLDVGPDAESAAASLPARDPNHKAVKSAVDATCVFDPSLSPQFYTKGAVPAVIVGDERRRIVYCKI